MPREGWRAQLDLRFAAANGRTTLAHRAHVGPLRVQRPFYPEGRQGACHVYVLHPPGGVVGGDELNVCVSAGSSARVLVTTPAANKFYRSAGAAGLVQQSLSVAPGAALEWLPQDNIVFDGAIARQETRVDLSGDAAYIGWEINCLGRPAASEKYTRGRFDTRLEVWRDNKPLFIERTGIVAGSSMLSAPWGLNGATVFGTLICIGQFQDGVQTVRRHWSGCKAATVTQLRHAVVGRYLGHNAEEARELFCQAWSVLRPAALGRNSEPPRIWAT